jgi:hypothetical protein
MLRVMTIFSPLRVFLPLSVTIFVAGALYGVYTIFTDGKIANLGVLLMTVAAVVFLIGLVSEQIATLRFDGRR